MMEFSGYIARRLCRRAVLEHERHVNNYASRVLPRSAAQRRTLHLKTHPSWIYPAHWVNGINICPLGY